jgi:hypothetical protein
MPVHARILDLYWTLTWPKNINIEIITVIYAARATLSPLRMRPT